MKRMKGSYTVEAALLMGILIALLAAVLYLMFYLHDQGFLQGSAHETVCAISLHADDEQNKTGLAQSLIKGKLLSAENVAADVSAGKKKAEVSYNGSITIFPLARIFFGSGNLEVKSRAVLTTRRPTVLIQKLRGAAKIVDRIRGD